jgi:hypothetical protein
LRGLWLRGGGGGGGGGLWGGRHAQDVGLEQLDGAVEVGDACAAQALVGRGDELFDGGLVLLEARVDVFFVDEAGALGLGEDEVEQEEEADVGVEGDPAPVLG